MIRSRRESAPATAATPRRAVLIAAFCLAALAAPQRAPAGCGCRKAPPDAASVRPNATYPGTQVTLFSPGFQVGQVYAVDFISGTTSVTATVTGTIVSKRDIADAVIKPQLVVTVPSLPLGPTQLKVRLSNLTTPMMVIADSAFTVAPAPIAAAQDVGSSNVAGYRAAVGRDGTVYIALDMSAVRLPRVFRAQALGYPLRFTSDDVAFSNIQGFLMQLLNANMPGLFSIASANSTVDSDILGYSRHEFNTFYLQHGERQAHQVVDGAWHTDGTRHVDHDHLVLALSATLANGSLPTPGATPPFTLALNTFTLFHEGLIGVQEVRLRNDAVVDSYESGTVGFGNEGDVVSNGKIVLEDNGVIDGDATAPRVDVTDHAIVTGIQTQSRTPVGFMPVQVPDGLRDLGEIVVLENQSRTIEPGSYRASRVFLDKNGILDIQNSAGPVTLYVTGSVEGRGNESSITTADPNPEKFALYVVGGNKVEFRNGGSFYGVIYAPQSSLEIRNGGEFFGSFVGNTVLVRNLARVHYDRALRGP